ncbi:MAG TPA: helix-turn-helix domain-containing protein, partial [Thermoanaerobaculia bacterium]|nr:helix-turn-helix domain-containing protein [Thermoanaerobaculia bacterium]
LDDDPAAVADLAALQERLGTGATRLHGLVRTHFHTTPRELLLRRRIGAACRRLLAGDERVLDVAMAVGFDSLSAFHAAFAAVTRMAPGDYRRLREGAGFTLRLPRDFRAESTLAFLGRDPESPTERVRGTALQRALALPEGPALLTVELHPGAALCQLAANRPPSAAAMASAHATALRLLGLQGDPRPFERRVAADPELGRLLDGRRGLRIPQCPTPFEALVWAILGQQVNLRFAYTLRRRLVARCGAAAGDGLATHPAPQAIAACDEVELTRLQLSRGKARYLLAAARAVTAGDCPLDELARGPATTCERALRALAGVGPWTAAYVMMRGFGFADCVPVGDAGLARALERFFALPTRPQAVETAALMRPFAPYRSFATTHFWTTLGGAA